MPIDFPSSPAINATYVYGGKTYRFGGVYWSAVNLADQGVVIQNNFYTPQGASWKEISVVPGTNLVGAMVAPYLDYL